MPGDLILVCGSFGFLEFREAVYSNYMNGM